MRFGCRHASEIDGNKMRDEVGIRNCAKSKDWF